jgi:hypothetical protein
MSDSRTISMPLSVYNKDLAEERELGKIEALRRLKYALDQHKKGDSHEAYLVLVEDFGNQGHEVACELGIRKASE